MTEFYNVKTRQMVTVPANKVQHKMTANGRHQLVATMDGMKMYKFVSADEAKRYK
jgi:hypothetical protein